MTGTKMARIRKCHTCPHRFTRHVEAQKWPQCDGGSTLLYLDDFIMEGDETYCPQGLWKGLTPVDLEAEKAAAEARMWEEQVAYWTPIAQALLKGQPEVEVANRIEELVKLKVLTPEVAAEAASHALDARGPA